MTLTMVLYGMLAVGAVFFLLTLWCACVLAARTDEHDDKLWEEYKRRKGIK